MEMGGCILSPHLLLYMVLTVLIIAATRTEQLVWHRLMSELLPPYFLEVAPEQPDTWLALPFFPKNGLVGKSISWGYAECLWLMDFEGC